MDLTPTSTALSSGLEETILPWTGRTANSGSVGPSDPQDNGTNKSSVGETLLWSTRVERPEGAETGLVRKDFLPHGDAGFLWPPRGVGEGVVL